MALAAALATGASVGAINGYLVGYLRLRAFLTTLVTFIIGRALFDILVVNFAARIQLSARTSDLWDFIGDGTIYGLSVSVLVAVSGGDHRPPRAHPLAARLACARGRRLAPLGPQCRHPGPPDRLHDLCLLRPAAAALAGFLIACRLSGAGPGTGLNLEIMALTAAVVGGNSLGGGRGSVAKGMMGAIIVLVMTNGLIRLGYGTGTNQMVLGLMLAAAVTLDIRWLKNRHKVLNEVYVAPIYHRMGETQSAAARLGHALRARRPAGGGRADRAWRARRPGGRHPRPRTTTSIAAPATATSFASSRPTTSAAEVFAHIGGFPLGLAFDRDGNLIACVGGMGLYSIARDGEVTQLSAETNRSWTSIIDDARLRDPNDCDIAPDGRIFFTDSTTRYDIHDWALDCDREPRDRPHPLSTIPKTGTTRTLLDGYRYANGVCIAHDGQSLFFAETWACRVHRYWFDGPKAGSVECVIKDMPGYPDNINRASDGNYWMAWLGMRTPSFDLALRHPGDAQAHGPPAAAGRMAVPEHQHRLRGEVRRDGPRSSKRSAT